jgi:transcriptional regulator with XRE-family HTH domain
MLTEFGKFVKNQCTNVNLKQEELATELNISAATLSNYMNGKNVPEMEMILALIKRFNLFGKDIKELLTKAFNSTGQKNKKIILDTKILTEERLKLLVEAIVILLCNPNNSGGSVYEKCPSNQLIDFNGLQDSIENCYKKLS